MRWKHAGKVIGAALALLGAHVVADAGNVPVVLSEARLFETRTPLAQNIGRMRWLDAQSLAITTASGKWWEPRLVVADLSLKNVRTLLDAGSLQCVDGRDSVVSVTEGSQARMYAGQASVEEPRFIVYRWDPSSKALVDPRASAPQFAGWSRCTRGAESVPDTGLALNMRSLGGRDGELGWSETGRGAVVWRRPGASPVTLDVTVRDIAPTVLPLPHLDAFLLASGRFKAAAQPVTVPGVGSVFVKLPMVMLQSDGRIRRVEIPDATIPVIAREFDGEGIVLPSAVGPLAVVEGQRRQGVGFYLIEGDRPRLLWRSAPGIDSGISDITLSPDGCSAAFTAANSGLGGPVRVLTFCAR